MESQCKKAKIVKLMYSLDKYKEVTGYKEVEGYLKYLDGCYVYFYSDASRAKLSVGTRLITIDRSWCIVDKK